MKINEIVYASGIQSISGRLDPALAGHAGYIENYEIRIQVFPDSAAVLLLDAAEKILAYMVIQEVSTNVMRLRQIENVSNIPGAIVSIIYFLSKKLNFKVIVDKTEPLTSKGLDWVVKIMANNRNMFIITDLDGNPPDIDTIKKEWEDSRADASHVGEYGIIIESTALPNGNTQMFEDTSATILKTAYQLMHNRLLP